MGMVGSLLGGVLADKAGRKPVLLAGQLPMLLAWGLSGAAQSFSYLVAARVLSGFSDGLLYSLLPVYISELADVKLRGKVITFQC